MKCVRNSQSTAEAHPYKKSDQFNENISLENLPFALYPNGEKLILDPNSILREIHKIMKDPKGVVHTA